MVENTQNEELSKKLNVVIALLNDIKFREDKAQIKEKIAYFVRFGLNNRDVSEILDISEKHVSKEKSLLKKGSVENG
jgi:DNA-binding NarL/FixJ family response regulator